MTKGFLWPLTETLCSIETFRHITISFIVDVFAILFPQSAGLLVAGDVSGDQPRKTRRQVGASERLGKTWQVRRNPIRLGIT